MSTSFSLSHREIESLHPVSLVLACRSCCRSRRRGQRVHPAPFAAAGQEGQSQAQLSPSSEDGRRFVRDKTQSPKSSGHQSLKVLLFPLLTTLSSLIPSPCAASSKTVSRCDLGKQFSLL